MNTAATDAGADLASYLAKMTLPKETETALQNAPSVAIARNIDELEAIACGAPGQMSFTVGYDLPDGSHVHEVDVVRLKNGISGNYRETYMRRRDPNCMLVADDRPSDKPRFTDRFDFGFDVVRQETFDWLATQDLAIFAFEMGQWGLGADALAICPRNAGFFAFGLGLLQGVQNLDELDRTFKPRNIIYVAPPFRHTHFDGKQVVVHNRTGEVHEIYSYNLYPGPSAKKGVYGALIEMGEQEGWVTAHCSSVQVVTPYDNTITFMHEGASGGGKSEMTQQPHRLPDGRLLLGQNVLSNEKRYLEIPRTCDLHPVCDDMAMCHPDIQKDNGKLSLADGENGWFIRVDHITKYGTDPDLEELTIHPPRSLLFLNIDAKCGSTGLIWEPIMDSEDTPCPNPRVVVPREIVPNVVSGDVEVDIRTFGVRTPPCTKENPTYGIMGLMHILPPALAWLWRLVAPRGHANPSIVDTGGMSSEGVGSYWPFSTGKRIAQANLLLDQFRRATRTRYVLIPNQHVGAWKTGFMPQWLVRDYLARRGLARFQADQLSPARCPLLGSVLNSMRIEGSVLSRWFLQPETQPEVGIEAYDEGAKILKAFFDEQLDKFLAPELDPLGKKIIECCKANGSVEEMNALIESKL